MSEKFSLRFRDWRIQTKLMVIFILLSWIPVIILLGINLNDQLNASQVEIENRLLRVVSSTVREIQINASRYIKDNHVALQLVADDDTLIDALVSVGEIPVGESREADAPKPPASPTPPPTPEKGVVPPPPGQGSPPPEAGAGSPPSDQGPPEAMPTPAIDQAPPPEDGVAQGGEGQPGQGIPVEIFANEYTEAASAFLSDYEIQNVGQQEIGVYNAQGIMIAASQAEAVGMLAMGRADIEAALAGSLYTESIHLNPETNVPGFFISAPISSGTEIVGAVVSRLQAQFIIDTLSTATAEREDLQTELDIFIVDNYGIVMAHSDPQIAYLYHSLGELSAEELAEIEAYHLLGQLGTPSAIPALQPLADALGDAFAANASGTFRYCMPDVLDSPVDDNCSNGSYYMAGFDPLEDPITGDILFMIVTSIPEAQFIDPIKQQAIYSIGGAVLMSLLLFVIALVIARTMAHPIKVLMGAAETVESDEPFAPELLETISAQGDELGKLATIFSKMALVVQERELKLRQTVEKLRVQIDQSQRKKDVGEIVEGDFFKELQAKAREAKEQKRKANAEDQSETDA